MAAAKQRELKLKAEVAAALVKERQAHAALDSVKQKEALLQREEERAEKTAEAESHEIDVVSLLIFQSDLFIIFPNI